MVEVSEGSILIDGVDIATITLHKLRYTVGREREGEREREREREKERERERERELHVYLHVPYSLLSPQPHPSFFVCV